MEASEMKPWELQQAKSGNQDDQGSVWNRYRRPDSPRTVRARPEGISGGQALKSALQGAAQGLTFGLADEMEGVLEIPSYLSENPDMTIAEAYAAGRDAAREGLSTSREDAPVLTGVGDMAGALISGSAAYKALGSPNTLLGSASFGAAEGLADAAGRSRDAEDFAGKSLSGIPLGAAMGGIGYSASEIYNRIKRPRAGADDIRQQQAKALGIELTPAQKTGDQALHRFEAAQQSDPGYGSAFDKMKDRNQAKYNKIAAKTIGLDSDKLTEVQLGKAARDISQRFKNATETGDQISFDDEWLDDLANLETQYRKVWGKSGASPKIINDILETTERGRITPEEYQRRYSQLGKDLERAKVAGDMHKMELYGGLRTSLDNLVDRNADGLSQQFKDARRLYKNKMLLEKPGVLRTETGDVSPLILANKLRKDVRGYLEGGDTSDLYNMARVAQATKSGIGDSGTATRSKDLMDFLTSPAKERMGQAYLSGEFGAGIMGPSTGKSGAANKYIYSLMQSPEAIRAVLENEDRYK